MKLETILREMTRHSTEGGLQQIYNIGDPSNDLEIRFEQGDTELLLMATEEGSSVKLWLTKKELQELDEVVQRALQAIH